MTSAPFEPLLAGGVIAMDSLAGGRGNVPTHSFEPATAAMKSPQIAAPVAHVEHGEPSIILERQGETITHIRVQCGCGKVIELKCEY